MRKGQSHLWGSQDTVSPIRAHETNLVGAQPREFSLLILVVEPGAPDWKSLQDLLDRKA